MSKTFNLDLLRIKMDIASLKSTISSIESEDSLYVFNARRANYFKLKDSAEIKDIVIRQVRAELNNKEDELKKFTIDLLGQE